jgi:mono/diheme cytochrome c family protein
MTRQLLVTLGFLAIGCGPKDVIPTAPGHPANPAAPTAPVAQATPDAAAPAPSGGDAALSVTAPDTQAIAAADKAAYDKAWPVLEKHCAGCHTSAGTRKAKKKAMPHFSMDGYPFGGHHAEEIGENVREVLGATGEKPTMPADKPGAVKGAELEAVVEWTRAFDAAQAAGLHKKAEHEGHRH